MPSVPPSAHYSQIRPPGCNPQPRMQLGDCASTSSIAIRSRQWDYRMNNRLSIGWRDMPYDFHFDRKHRILRCRLCGQVSDAELKVFYRAAHDLALRLQPAAGIMDGAAVTSFDVTSQTIRQLANSEPIIPDPTICRVAIAPSSEVFGMVRIFELLGQDTRPNLHVVRTEREAWAILGVQNPLFTPVESE
jgi:hypothetical protein